MSTVSSVLIDRNDVFVHPSNWVPIDIYVAYLLSAHVPVVAVYTVKGKRHSVLLASKWAKERISFNLDAKGTKFYKQVGINDTTAARSPVSTTMSLSQAGIDFMLGYETMPKKSYNASTGRYYPYNDDAGNPTIGYGHLIKKGEDFSKGLTLAQAQKLYADDASNFVANVNKALKVGLSQNQFDALVDLAFNLGNANQQAHILNAGGALQESDFTKYDRSGGVVMKGLLERRVSEWIMFSQNIYDSRHGEKI